MTNRELLELAAKAAGYKVRVSEAGSFSIDDGQYWISWNPYKDEQAAARLAVDSGIAKFLKLPAGVDGFYIEFNPPLVFDGDECEEFYSAQRRAIVRAAAGIGKAIGAHG